MRNYLIKLINYKENHLTLNSNINSNYNSVFEKFAKNTEKNKVEF